MKLLLKNILILGCLLSSVGNCFAGGSASVTYDFDGDGNATYPNEGYIYVEASTSGVRGEASYEIATSAVYNDLGNNVNYYMHSTQSASIWVGQVYGYYWQVNARAEYNDIDLPNCYARIKWDNSEPPEMVTGWDVSSNNINAYMEFLDTSDPYIFEVRVEPHAGSGTSDCSVSTQMAILVTTNPVYSISGNIGCLDNVSLWKGSYFIETNFSENIYGQHEYEFKNLLSNTDYSLIFSDGHIYDFSLSSDETYNYAACLYVYGYTCGVGDIHLYVDDGGWVLEDTVSQNMTLSDYEMLIESGNDYKLNMHGISQLVDTYLFSCTGDHVLYSYDRCVYPPSPSPYYPIDPIILWEGYDYNIVLLRDNHGNYIENAQVAIYDQTNSTYIQKWTPNPDGYLLLGALFNDSDHNTQVMVRTFDGVFTLETTYPANGSSPVGSEDITQTNMTIPIHYNIQMDTQDQFGTPLTGVFCGLAEYAPYNPLSFWGYSMGGRQYVPVTNCSGFAMCDIYAEKGGYGDYDVTALNWTSRSAMVKDYRHEIVMVEE